MSGYYGPSVENDVVMDPDQHIRDEIAANAQMYGLDEAQVAAVKALDDDTINEAIDAATQSVEAFWEAYQQVRAAAVAALVKQAPTELVVRWTSTVEETYQVTLTGAEVAEYRRLLDVDDVDEFLAAREDKAIETATTDRHVEG